MKKDFFISKKNISKTEWSSEEHSLAYLKKADQIPHRSEGENVLFDHISNDMTRVLDLGTGDGRLLKLLKSQKPNINAIAIDVSPFMLDSVKRNFTHDSNMQVIEHDLDNSLPNIGYFDAVISSFAIHHLSNERKHSLYKEIYDILNPEGIFCNLDNVSSPSEIHHIRFLNAIGFTPETESKSDNLLSMEKQLRWLKDIGFKDVDCYWKWLEMALFIGYK
ncbi:MAG: class I SAM-dependent methyltransferase [Thermoproteota archaeon]|nr:class I SAM-dependent methyltransferase [Thermoproteota archaeon]